MGKKRKKEVTIMRPPAVASFQLPSREQILDLRVWDSVQLIFCQKGRLTERMWVKITKKSDTTRWTGILDNNALNLDIRYHAKVRFHPYDIINIMPRATVKSDA